MMKPVVFSKLDEVKKKKYLNVVIVNSPTVYYYGKNDNVKPNNEQNKQISKPVITKEEVEKTTKKLKEVLKNNQTAYNTPNHELDDKIAPPKKIVKREIKVSPNKPKLAIIIDDVCTKTQVRRIHNLGLTVTMSFFPPSKVRPNSAKLASKEKFYVTFKQN